MKKIFCILPFLLFVLVRLQAQDSTQNFVVLKEIVLEGNKKTKEIIIFREIELKAGDTLWQDKEEKILETTKNRIFNLNLFIDVGINLEKHQDQTATLRIQLKERLYIFVAPIFEIADRNFNEWWYDRNKDFSRTNYGVILTKKNLRGRNETLEFNAQAGFVQRFKLAYKIPYIDQKQEYGLNFYVNFSQFKNLAFQTNHNKLDFLRSENLLKDRWQANITLRKRKGFYEFQNLQLGYTYNRISDTIAQLNTNYHLSGEKTQKFFHISYEYIYDNRDFASYPLKGEKLLVGFSKYGFWQNDLDLWILRAEYQYHREILKKFYGSWAVGTRLFWHKGQPYSNAQALGYGNDLVRGYQLYVIDGQHYALAKANLKYELFSIKRDLRFIPLRQFRTIPLAMYPKIFFDTGYVQDNVFGKDKNPLANQVLWGTGIGVDMVTYYNSVFQLDFSLNSLRQFGVFFNFESSF
jgi:outer membrane protein assembly factor BamA